MKERAELGGLGRRHLTEIQQMAPSLDDDRSGARRAQRGVLREEVLAGDDVAAWARCIQKDRRPLIGGPEPTSSV
jgi:hypothetical protein